MIAVKVDSVGGLSGDISTDQRFLPLWVLTAGHTAPVIAVPFTDELLYTNLRPSIKTGERSPNVLRTVAD